MKSQSAVIKRDYVTERSKRQKRDGCHGRRRLFIPRLGISVKKRELYVLVLHSFQKLGYDQPTYEQAQAVCEFALLLAADASGFRERR